MSWRWAARKNEQSPPRLEKTGGDFDDGLHSVSMCGELLSHTFGHLDIHLWGSEKGSDVLSTIGMAGSDYWTQLRRGA